MIWPLPLGSFINDVKILCPSLSVRTVLISSFFLASNTYRYKDIQRQHFYTIRVFSFWHNFIWIDSSRKSQIRFDLVWLMTVHRWSSLWSRKMVRNGTERISPLNSNSDVPWTIHWRRNDLEKKIFFSQIYQFLFKKDLFKRKKLL
jgi:hypothetical protein